MAGAKRDYYEVLGLERDAGRDDVKRAFRVLARELHPDVSNDPAAEQRFGEVAEAYSVLSKPVPRLLYDRYGYVGPGNGWFRGAPAGTTSSVDPESNAYRDDRLVRYVALVGLALALALFVFLLASSDFLSLTERL